MLRFPELALVQAYSHVYCAICLLVAASLDAPLFAVQTEAAGMNSISCRLLLFPAAADLMADGILQIFCACLRRCCI